MGVLSNLEPKEVFHFFEELCKIPHPSFKEDRISDYCVKFAEERGLEVYQDELKNVVIIKEATPGYEDVEPLIIQGHLDMVCEKEPGCDIDFEKDGLKLQVEGDYIQAEGTTLGGDDGIAVAYALAVLDSKTLEHPRIEVVFTVSEEVGMEGATAIDLSMLKGRKLLNIDSEEEGYLLTSCAGGCSCMAVLPVQRVKKSGVCYLLSLEGLTGGHSGVEIDKGRGNSNVLMGRFLMGLDGRVDYSVKELSGGLKDNAIPRETDAVIVVDERDAQTLEQKAAEYSAVLAREYAASDPGVVLKAERQSEREENVLTGESLKKVIVLLNHMPNGIQSMSMDIPGLVETSLNLGVVTLSGQELKLRYAVRSSVESARDFVADKIKYLIEYMGGSLALEGVYPAWEYKKDSGLREMMVRVYKEMYGKEPVIQAIHAGLECGILSGKLDNLDCISFGPDMAGIHTTEEKLNIPSTKRVWEYLVEVIRQK